MIKIPYEQMIEKITSNSGMSQDEIQSRIDSKLKQLSGLVSQEGAAYIVANELGINLIQSGGKMKIKDLHPGLRDAQTSGKVINKYETRTFVRNGVEGKVASLLMGDETGKIRAVCWGSNADKVEEVKSGDIISINGGYVKENNNYPEVHINDRSTISLNPEGEKIDIDTEVKRKNIQELTDNDTEVEILGHVVQVFDPRYYEVCPECRKRIRNDSGAYLCPAHGEVEPTYSYVFNLILDDGTETIQSVFFSKSAEIVLGKNHEEMLSLKDSPGSMIDLKNSLLGKQLKLLGRVNHNDMFDRKDFIVNRVDDSPDPQEEIDRLKSSK